MKNKIMGMVIGGVLVAGVLGTVSAYSTNIWSPIQFVKQLFVNPTGQVGDVQGATIKIDGTNGRIDAKSIYENRVQVATKSDLNSYATKSYVDSKVKGLASKSYVDTQNKSQSSDSIVSVCNASNLGKHNKLGWTCEKNYVTNDKHCIDGHSENVEYFVQYSYSHFKCNDGRLREGSRGSFCMYSNCTKLGRTKSKNVGYVRKYWFVK